MTQSVEERREFTRFLVEDNAVAVLGPLNEGLGLMIELSTTGFSFRCEGDEEVPDEMDEILTLFGFETVCLGKVHMTTVSDEPVCDDNGDVINRRLGIRFDDLTDEQKTQLHNFIYDNAYIELAH